MAIRQDELLLRWLQHHVVGLDPLYWMEWLASVILVRNGEEGNLLPKAVEIQIHSIVSSFVISERPHVARTYVRDLTLRSSGSQPAASYKVNCCRSIAASQRQTTWSCFRCSLKCSRELSDARCARGCCTSSCSFPRASTGKQTTTTCRQHTCRDNKNRMITSPTCLGCLPSRVLAMLISADERLGSLMLLK